MNQKFDSDDHSRHAGPQYLDRVSLSDAYETDFSRSDALIYDEAQEALLNASGVDASDIEISVEQGVVTLSGRVANRAMKKEAELSLQDVLGIKDVFNLLTLSEFSDVGGEGLVKNQARI